MTLADLAGILGLVVLVAVYVGFRLGERGGCPSCHGPGGCGADEKACVREPGAGGGGGEGTTGTEANAPGGGGRRP